MRSRPKPPTTSQSAVLRNEKIIVLRGSVWACSALRLIYPASWPASFKGQSSTASGCPGRVDCAESSSSQSYGEQCYDEKNKSGYLLLYCSSKIQDIIMDGVCILTKIPHWDHSPNPSDQQEIFCETNAIFPSKTENGTCSAPNILQDWQDSSTMVE